MAAMAAVQKQDAPGKQGIPCAENVPQGLEYREDNVSYWTNRAPGYSRQHRAALAAEQHGVWSRTLQECIQNHFRGCRPAHIRVLEIGTGPGFLAILLDEMGYAVTAIDYTEEMLRQARINAGARAEHIQFLQMDAQALTFPEESFDVIVSRNLTWNLCSPLKAYDCWTRALKPGGLLLNFDANWYRYLYDDQALAGHLADRSSVIQSGIRDDREGTDIDAMESLAKRAPLSMRLRPQWDLEVLERLGMRAEADSDIWRRVWTREEWINNASTPMFLIYAVKQGQGAEASEVSSNDEI